MPKQYRKHLTFQAGEISPRYFGRSDAEIYTSGLDEALNMIVDQRGGIYKRTGLLHTAQIVANNARVFTLQATRTRFYTIVIYDSNMLIIAPGAKIAGDNLLLNGTFLNFGANWDTQTSPGSSNIDFSLGECALRPNQTNPSAFSRVSQEATVTAATTDNHVVIVAQNTTAQIQIDIGTSDGDNDIASIISTDHEIELEFIPNNATYWVSVTAFGADTVEARLTFIGTADASVVNPDGILMPAPWSEDQLNEIHIIESQEGDSLYFTHPNVPVNKLVYDRATDIFTDLAEVVFTSPPPEWAGNNHPSTGTAFQGRLFLGGTPAQSQTIWGSVSGSPEDFTVDAGQDDSALEFTLQRFGRIEWMLGTKNLIVGTDTGENVIVSEGAVLTPSDLGVEIQSAYGSNNIQAIQVAEKVFYVTPDGRKVRAMSYNRDENNWLSQDLNFVSEHVTIPVTTRTAWGQHPNDLLMMSLGDGNVAVLTYDRTATTVAWTRFDLGDFNVIDIDTGRENGINKFVVVGQRTPGTIDIEIQAPANQFLDSYVSKFDVGGTNIIDGLDYLEGVEVRPIVDGAVDPLQTVIGGQITTQRTGNQLYAGVGYSGRIRTLPPDGQQQIRSWKKRWNKVWAYLLDSKQPLINGLRPPDRTPSTLMDTVEPDRTGHFKTVDLGWDDFGQITIEQDLPVAMYVLAIYGEMGAETL